MIQHLENLPSNIVGFKATGEITEKDFIQTVIPKVKALIDKTDNLNYLLVLDTLLRNFTIGAWMKDAMMGINYTTPYLSIRSSSPTAPEIENASSHLHS